MSALPLRRYRILATETTECNFDVAFVEKERK